MKRQKTVIGEIIRKKAGGERTRTDIGTTKYLIFSQIDANGVVERPDVVGAIFGQTEGLLGDDLDLRELQRTGRIGRISVTVNSRNGRSRGSITIPSSLDKIETAVLGASLETIDRVGPCEAKITVTKIEDVRTLKRNYVVDRAKQLVKSMFTDVLPESQEITEEVKESIRIKEITKYGKDNLPAGPNIDDSDAIIVVEGRADVLNMLRYGIRNAVAVEGTSIPKTIIDLSKEKTVTCFVDGDRGGELIFKELMQVAEVDYVARAPTGKEVEDLTKKETIKALRNKIPVEQAMTELFEKQLKEESQKEEVKEEPPPPNQPEGLEGLKEFIDKLPGTLDAYLLDAKYAPKIKVSVRDLVDAISLTDDVRIVVFDGVVTQRLVDVAAERGIERLVGIKIGNIVKKPVDLKILSFGNMIEEQDEIY
ncbi:MAG: DNA primase [Theionarchaea archaeon]|nr:DNA primase [Theionarchaea archaeon]MBU7000027.1 DNA primase [Theionarchaea archaeon]MBU7021675.1 DNA primase [Theionarchaea archaeon]MBU7035023.1 DNA primase [Theionarchaea archaeon]MBU7040317.1 DNA primase [Theionarchaea archaeon]